MKSFSKKAALSFGWETFKKNWKFLLVVAFISFLASYIPSFLQSSFQEDAGIVAALIGVAGSIIQMIITIGMTVIALKFVDGKKPVLEDLYKHYSLLLNYFLSSVVYGLIVLAGLILLVIPGIYFALKYQFYSYYIIDKKMGVMESIKASGKLTNGHLTNLLLLGLIYIGLVILGVLAFGIGIFIVMPVLTLSYAWVFRKLSS